MYINCEYQELLYIIMHLWSALQQGFSSPECKTLHQWTLGLTSVLPELTCLNIYINIYTHAQSLGHSIVLQCHCIWHAFLITIQCNSDHVPTYIVYATPSSNSLHKSQEELWIQSKEGFHNTLNCPVVFHHRATPVVKKTTLHYMVLNFIIIALRVELLRFYKIKYGCVSYQFRGVFTIIAFPCFLLVKFQHVYEFVQSYSEYVWIDQFCIG